MASEAMDQIKAVMRASRQTASGNPAPSIEELRSGMEQMLAALPPVPGGRVEPVDAGGVPAEFTFPEDGRQTAGTLLYLHGGGYFQGSPVTHRRLVTALCLAAGMRGLSIDYRLAPEHRFPAAVDDALAAYRWLTGPEGEDPARVVVAGDSAGGGLSAALLVALRDAGDRLPAGAYLLSPWTDLAATGDSMRTRADADPMIDPSDTEAVGRRYAGDRDLRDPLISPLYADLTGLPPLLIHVGDAEVLLDDATRMADRAAGAGVPVEVEVWPEAFHVFQMMVGLLPEADEAVAQAGAWMAKRIEAD
ncbi:MAG TPA: alpha/beta hydrolase [Acidimicrobiales bacterium]|nr:alpha/beta hydrolase [Acidimicrobiales bacterium]